MCVFCLSLSVCLSLLVCLCLCPSFYPIHSMIRVNVSMCLSVCPCPSLLANCSVMFCINNAPCPAMLCVKGWSAHTNVVHITHIVQAPEILMGQRYDNLADLWSVGTILFQCLSGSAPFLVSRPLLPRTSSHTFFPSSSPVFGG